MFIYGYYIIKLTKDRHPMFPARCVVCGKAVNEVKKIFQSPYIPVDLFLSKTTNAPAHERCAKALLSAHYLRLLSVLPIIILIMSVIYGAGVWMTIAAIILYVLLMVSVYLLARARWGLKSPLPFRFYISNFSNEVNYAFLDKEYAEEFAHLNDTEIAPG